MSKLERILEADSKSTYEDWLVDWIDDAIDEYDLTKRSTDREVSNYVLNEIMPSKEVQKLMEDLGYKSFDRQADKIIKDIKKGLK